MGLSFADRAIFQRKDSFFLGPFSIRNIFRFIFSLAALKRWVLIMGKAWKWDLDQ